MRLLVQQPVARRRYETTASRERANLAKVIPVPDLIAKFVPFVHTVLNRRGKAHVLTLVAVVIEYAVKTAFSHLLITQ